MTIARVIEMDRKNRKSGKKYRRHSHTILRFAALILSFAAVALLILLLDNAPENSIPAAVDSREASEWTAAAAEPSEAVRVEASSEDLPLTILTDIETEAPAADSPAEGMAEMAVSDEPAEETASLVREISPAAPAPSAAAVSVTAVKVDVADNSANSAAQTAQAVPTVQIASTVSAVPAASTAPEAQKVSAVPAASTAPDASPVQTGSAPSAVPEAPAASAVQTASAALAPPMAQTVSDNNQENMAAPEPRVVSVQADKLPETVRRAKIVCVGDNLMHRDVSMSGLRDDGSFNYDYNFSKVKPLVSAADIAIINQECVTAGNHIGIRDYPSFNARTEVIEAIRNAGFDVVLAANNHILDMGPGGPVYMLQFFREHYPELMLLGIHDSWESRDEIYVKEVNGIRIGMVNYTDILNNKVDYAGREYLVDYLDYTRLESLIRRTKAASDFLIVFPHWGTEYNLGTDQKQAEETAFLASLGVDLVLGGHPHVVEPVEYVDRPDGGKMLVYYSLGNFQSLQRTEATLLGGMAKVDIVMDCHGTRIEDFNLETLVTDYRLGGRIITDYFDIITTYPWSSYSKDIASSSKIGNGNPDFSLEKMFRLQAVQAEQVRRAREAAGLQ